MTLAASFLTNGRLHLLEDGEIVMLLMVACGCGRLPDSEPVVAIPGSVRLLH